MSWRRFLRRNQSDADLVQEIAVHMTEEIEENLARGMSPEEARRRAFLKFGNPQRVRENLRLQNTLTAIDNLWQDVKYAVRQIRRSPAFAATVIATLAVGIGAAAAMFTVVDHVLLRPLPYAQAERLVALDGENSSGESAYVPLPAVEQWREQSRTLEQIALYRIEEERSFLQGNQSSMPIDVTRGSANLFDTLGVRPQFGRGFQPEDPCPRAERTPTRSC
jgi:hypothetical protein